jgi:GntR family transcriptional regulator
MEEISRRTSRLPLYEQLRMSLLSSIRDGSLAPGDRVESEAELCARFAVSRTVVRQALGELTQEGYLTRIQGKGTFVSEPRQHEYMLREYFLHTAGGFTHDVEASGHDVASRVVGLRTTDASDAVVSALELIMPRVVLLERLRDVDGAPVVYTRSYLPPNLCPDFEQKLRTADLDRQSLYSFLEEECGVRIVAASRKIEAVIADEELASRLQLPAGAPLLLLTSVARDTSGRPVEYFDSWHRGDRTRFEISLGGEMLSPESVNGDGHDRFH